MFKHYYICFACQPAPYLLVLDAMNNSKNNTTVNWLTYVSSLALLISFFLPGFLAGNIDERSRHAAGKFLSCICNEVWVS